MRVISHWAWPLLWVAVVPVVMLVGSVYSYEVMPNRTGACGPPTLEAPSRIYDLPQRAIFRCPLFPVDPPLTPLLLNLVPAFWLQVPRSRVRLTARTATGLGALSLLVAQVQGTQIQCVNNFCAVVPKEILFLWAGPLLALVLFLVAWSPSTSPAVGTDQGSGTAPTI